LFDQKDCHKISLQENQNLSFENMEDEIKKLLSESGFSEKTVRNICKCYNDPK
jgi:hypothetical protein